MKKIIVILITGAFIFASCVSLPDIQLGAKVGTNKFLVDAQSAYQMISVEELDARMRANDLFLVNVHIPLEGSIPGTDQTIPYNAVEDFLDLLPADEDEPIYLYCLSDSMGHTAAQTLLDLGYSTVFNLEGGYNAWRAAGLPFSE